MAKIIPRGIRNNNPLNIRHGNVWFGEVPTPTDAEFEQFCQMEYGIRAAFVILRRYIRRYGHNTVRSIITTWAPSSENNTGAYIMSVCKRTGLDPDEMILYEDKETMCKLVAAMCVHENGESIDPKKIEMGYKMA